MEALLAWIRNRIVGFPCLEKDCVSSFSPAALAEAMPKFLLHLLPLTSQFSPVAPAEALPKFPSDIAKKIRLGAAEMGFHESPLTSQPLFIKGLSRGEWSVG